jgi:hypothetical protein
MHAWHDVPVDESAIEDHFPVIVEVPLGSKNNDSCKSPVVLRVWRVLGIADSPASPKPTRS